MNEKILIFVGDQPTVQRQVDAKLEHYLKEWQIENIRHEMISIGNTSIIHISVVIHLIKR